MLKVILLACSLLIVFLAVPSSSDAQTGLRGEVVSFENGAVIGGAKIIVSAGSKKFETSSNNEGEYELILEPGRYDVQVEAPGFKKLKRKNVMIVGKGLFTYNLNMDSAQHYC